MEENFRGFLDRLRDCGELIDLRQPVDIRHVATLVDQSPKAIFFHNVIGYDMPVVSGLIRTQRRAILSMGCSTYSEIEAKLTRGIL
jgi:2,5-furandicarboxylate decarboxylase 1